MVGGIAVRRVGRRNTFAFLGRRAVRRAIRVERPDILVEDINKVPLFLARQGVPFCAIVPHLFGETVFEEAPVAGGRRGVAGGAAAPGGLSRFGVSRDQREHAGRSDRDEAFRPRRIRVIHPGVDSMHLTPDPNGRRTPAPTFLYVGRLKRYKGIGLAIAALAAARRVRPDLRFVVAGPGTTCPSCGASRSSRARWTLWTFADS